MHPMLRLLPLALAVAEKAIREFSNQWLAGLQPQLSLETAPDGLTPGWQQEMFPLQL